jgi:hypothetical protein
MNRMVKSWPDKTIETTDTGPGVLQLNLRSNFLKILKYEGKINKKWFCITWQLLYLQLVSFPSLTPEIINL